MTIRCDIWFEGDDVFDQVWPFIQEEPVELVLEEMFHTEMPNAILEGSRYDGSNYICHSFTKDLGDGYI